jgi:hypothetical protein
VSKKIDSLSCKSRSSYASLELYETLHSRSLTVFVSVTMNSQSVIFQLPLDCETSPTPKCLSQSSHDWLFLDS